MNAHTTHTHTAIHDRRLKNRHNSLPVITGINKLAAEYGAPKLAPASEHDEDDTEETKVAASPTSTNKSADTESGGGAKADLSANEKAPKEEGDSETTEDMRITENPWERWTNF